MTKGYRFELLYNIVSLFSFSYLLSSFFLSSSIFYLFSFLLYYLFIFFYLSSIYFFDIILVESEHVVRGISPSNERIVTELQNILKYVSFTPTPARSTHFNPCLPSSLPPFLPPFLPPSLPPSLTPFNQDSFREWTETSKLMLPCYGYERPLSLFALDHVDQTRIAQLKAAISGK